MSWGANTVALLNENDQKGSNLLGTLIGNQDGEAFDQNMFKFVRSASGVVRRHRFVKRICPCDADEPRRSREQHFFRKGYNIVTKQ
jgi:hypothetical protein